MADHRSRIESAINKYLKRQQTGRSEPKRKNKKPEDITVGECKSWYKRHGFDMSIIESKASYSQASGRYTSFTVESGYSDSSGNDKHGNAVYVEFKARGKRSTLREGQRDFLLRKIKTNCFAVCVDSAELLHDYYYHWISLTDSDRRKYLFSLIPKHRIRDSGGDLF